MRRLLIVKLIHISRPRFWLYLAGPYLIGFTAAITDKQQFLTQEFLLSFLYFLFPANFYLYGVNDLFDRDTDSVNMKKGTHEHLFVNSDQNVLMMGLLISLGTGVFYFLYLKSFFAQCIFLLFLLLSTVYSAPPLRFKMRTFWDSFSNVLYILPGILVYSEVTNQIPSIWVIMAGWLWCSAMHLFSAIPDITPDKKVGLKTSAVTLGKENSLRICFLLWLLASIIGLYAYPKFSTWILFIYPMSVVILLTKKRNVERFYWLFPWINAVVGMIGFFIIYFSRLSV